MRAFFILNKLHFRRDFRLLSCRKDVFGLLGEAKDCRAWKCGLVRIKIRKWEVGLGDLPISKSPKFAFSKPSSSSIFSLRCHLITKTGFVKRNPLQPKKHIPLYESLCIKITVLGQLPTLPTPYSQIPSRSVKLPRKNISLEIRV